MAISEYIRAPSGQIRAPQLANYGDAFKPLSNHLERLVAARDRKLAAQKEMDFQNNRDTKKNEFLKSQQDDSQAFQKEQQFNKIQANQDAAKTLNDNRVAAAETAHSYKVEDSKREHGYKVEDAKRNHGYNISEINTRGVNQRKLANLNLTNSKKLVKFKNKLTEKENKAYGKFLKPTVVYSKPDSIATQELTAKAQEIGNPKLQKTSESFFNKVNKVGSKLGVSYEDYSKSKDRVHTLMSNTGLSSSDFKEKPNTKNYIDKLKEEAGGTKIKAKSSKAQDKLDNLGSLISKDSKRLEELSNKGLTYNDTEYRQIQDKIDKNKKIANDISTLIENPKMVEISKASKVFKPMEDSFHNKQEAIKKDAFKQLGVKDYKTLSTDNSPHIDYEATIEVANKNLVDAMASGAPKHVISFLQKNLTDLERVNLNSQKELVSKNNTQKKIIRNTSISGINSQITSARDELRAINKQVAKDDGDISEKNKKRKLELVKELNKLNAELSSIKMN